MVQETNKQVVHREAVPTNPGDVSFQQLLRMSDAMAKSGLFGIKDPNQALSLMLVAQAEGKHPALVARDYDIIQGKPAKKAEAMLRDFQAAGGRVEWHKLDDTIADATFSHPQGGSVRISWDIARATQAGLIKKETWQKFTRAMLRSRCASEGIRTVWPGGTSGFHTPEEVTDETTVAAPTVGEAGTATPAARTMESNDRDHFFGLMDKADSLAGLMYAYQDAVRACRALKDAPTERAMQELYTEHKKRFEQEASPKAEASPKDAPPPAEPEDVV